MNNQINKQILYVGPYREKTPQGLFSLLIAATLVKSGKNVSLRPFYTEPTRAAEIGESIITQAEHSKYENYDVIIQHVPIKDAVKINSIPNNIIIPILNEQILDENSINKLLEFDKILVDTKLLHTRLGSLNTKLNNKLFTYDYDMPGLAGEINQFNIGLFHNSTKLYFIGDYNKNTSNVENLCHAFIKKNFSLNHILMLYLFNIDANTKNNIENKISEIYSGYGSNHTVKKILVAPIDCSLENLIIAHNTGSVYIDFQDDYINSLNIKLALLLKKQIVYFNDDCYRVEFTKNNSICENGCLGVSPSAIESKIEKSINNHFEQGIPFKKQHINQII